MSQEVDLSTPLTESERAYLAARGRYAELERADSMHGVTGVALPTGDGTAPVLHGTATYDVRDDRIAALERELALLRGGDGEDGAGEVSEDDNEDLEPYETWSVTELDAELKRRKLPVTGNKESKVNALYADDAATEQP